MQEKSYHQTYGLVVAGLTLLSDAEADWQDSSHLATVCVVHINDRI